MIFDKTDPIRKKLESLIDPKFPKIVPSGIESLRSRLYAERYGKERAAIEGAVRNTIFWFQGQDKLRLKSEYSAVDLLFVDMAANAVDWKEFFTRFPPLAVEGFDEKYCLKCWKYKKDRGTEHEFD